MGNWTRLQVPDSVPEDRASLLRPVGIRRQGITVRRWTTTQVMPDYSYDVSLLGYHWDSRGRHVASRTDGTVSSRKDEAGRKEFQADVPGAPWRERLWEAVEDLLRAGA